MRIAHVNLDGPPVSVDGIAAAVEMIANSQGEGPDEVTLFASDERRARGFVSKLHTVRSTSRRLRDVDPDVVHFHGSFRPVHAALAFSLRRQNLAYVVSPHSALSAGALRRQRFRKRLYLWLLERRTLMGAGTVICLSKVEADDVRSIEPQTTTDIVPNPAPDVASAIVADDQRQDVLITLCRFDVEQKGLDILAEIAIAAPEFEFRVFGETDVNDPSRAHALIAASPPNLSFEAPIRGEAKHELLAGAQGYVQTSRWEGLSLSVLEAIAAGTPCFVSEYISSTLGDLAPFVVVLPDEPRAAAATIRSARLNPHKLRLMADEGREAIARTHSVETVASALVGVYARVIARQHVD